MSTPGPADTCPRRSARERLALLLDADSFVETAGAGPTDQTVTGHGTVAGRSVCVYVTGVPTATGADRIARLVDLAARTGCPVVGVDDGGADPLTEGVAPLAAIGRVHRAMTLASGVVPQVAVVTGDVGGAPAMTAALADFVVLAGAAAGLHLSSTDAIATAGGVPDHRDRTGGVHHVAVDEGAAFEWVRTLINFLPQNNLSDPPPGDLSDPPPGDPDTAGSADHDLDQLVGRSAHRPYDVHTVINNVLDDGEFCELQADHALNLVCGFGRLEGRSVGVVANQPDELGGCLDLDAATKAARFVRTCDAFNIAVINFVDVPGFLPEQGYGVVRATAALVHAWAEATVPLLTVVTGVAHGPAYEVMASHTLGADLVLAWPTASIAAAPVQQTVHRLHHDELAAAADPETLRAELIKDLQQERADDRQAGELGLVDIVVPPHRTRAELARSLRLLQSKRSQQPPRKHGNIPL